MAKEDLKPGEYKFTLEDSKKGAARSVESRKRKKQMREELLELLNADITVKGKEMTGTQALVVKAFQQAMKGDWKAWELVRDTSGQKPIDKVMVAEIDPEKITEIEQAVEEALSEDESEP